MAVSRRSFLACLGAGAGAALGGWFRAAGGVRREPPLLRPPGALPEPEFLAACTRCGQCVEVCPYDTLKLAGPGQGVAAGTPYFNPEEVPCELCQTYDDLKCIAICPTGALQPVGQRADIRIGIAVVNEQTCYAFNGVSCRSCWHKCPFTDRGAITFDALLRPVVSAEACVGCGICTLACPTEPTSIPIRPRDWPDVLRGGSATTES